MWLISGIRGNGSLQIFLLRVLLRREWIAGAFSPTIAHTQRRIKARRWRQQMSVR